MIDRPVQQPRFAVLFAVLGLVILCRVLPYLLQSLGISFDVESSTYPWNFSPALPVAIFGAAYFTHKANALVLPLGIFLLSDLMIWLITGNIAWALYGAQTFVYGSLLLVAISGFLLRQNQSGLRLAMVGFSSATMFFVVSNFGVWISGSYYPHSVAGLIDCYFQAIPFYRNSLISMVVFLPILFSKLGLRSDLRPVSA